MKIFTIFQKSFKFMIKNPKLAIPRIISITIYTILMLHMLNITKNIFNILTPNNTTFIETMLPQLIIMTVLTLLAYFIDIFTYAMYPYLSYDYNQGNKISLTQSAQKVLKRFPTIIGFSLLILFFLSIISPVLSGFLIVAFISNSIFLISITLTGILIFVLIISLVLFFTIPIALIDDKKLIDSLKKGFNISYKNKKDISIINLFYLLLLILSGLLLYEADFQGNTAFLSITLFIITRLMQAVTYTYICITNPMLYLGLKS